MGVWIIKNRSGVERRFKNDNCAAAIAWKNSETKKRANKFVTYSPEWWNETYRKQFYSFRTYPWSKIVVDMYCDEINKIVNEHIQFENKDWTVESRDTMELDGLTIATIRIRVHFEAGPEDDIGLEETVTEVSYLTIRRDNKRPSKLVFGGY